MKFCKFMDDLPFIVKLILALPALDFIWGVYRAVKGAVKEDVVMLVIGIVWIFAGIPFLWIVDLICLVLKRPLFFA